MHAQASIALWKRELSAVFDHLEFSVGSIEKARAVYRPICQAIGGDEFFFDEGEKSAGFGTDDIVRLLLTEGSPTKPKMHICFMAGSKEGVDRAYAGALAGGAASNGEPGYREHYAPGYYAAFVFDPDGHNVEILFREPQPAATQ